jgi:septal ring-binding cell division protein DamX
MKKIYVVIGAAMVLLCGCAGQSGQIANATMESQQPWLCQGVSGEWQCNRDVRMPQQPADATEQKVAAATLEPEARSTPDKAPSSLDKPALRNIEPSTVADTAAPEVEVIKTPIAATVENAWTIQWAALSTAAAAQQYGIKYLADSGTDYEIRPIRVKNRDYYILFSGRYPSRAAAAEAAKQIRTASAEAPFFRTISSIKAASIK